VTCRRCHGVGLVIEARNLIGPCPVCEGLSANGAEGLGGHGEGFEVANQGVTRRSPGEGAKVNGGRAQSQEMDATDQPQYVSNEASGKEDKHNAPYHPRGFKATKRSKADWRELLGMEPYIPVKDRKGYEPSPDEPQTESPEMDQAFGDADLCPHCGGPNADKDPIGHYEFMADLFHKETGMYAPGKDRSPATGGVDYGSDEQWAAWRKFRQDFRKKNESWNGYKDPESFENQIDYGITSGGSQVTDEGGGGQFVVSFDPVARGGMGDEMEVAQFSSQEEATAFIEQQIAAGVGAEDNWLIDQGVVDEGADCFEPKTVEDLRDPKVAGLEQGEIEGAIPMLSTKEIADLIVKIAMKEVFIMGGRKNGGGSKDN
jgi:hypothetical protein